MSVSHVEARVLAGMAWELAEAGHGEEAREAAEHAIQVARGEGGRGVAAEAVSLLVLGRVARRRDDEGAVRAFRAAAGLFGEVGDRRGEGRALLELGQVCSEVGEYAESVEVLVRAEAYAESEGERAALYFNLGRSLHLTGRDEEALPVARRAVEVAARLRGGDDANADRTWNEGMALHLLGGVLSRLGRAGEAAGTFERAAGLLLLAGDRQAAADAYHGSGQALSEHGDVEGAIAAFRRAAPVYAELGDGEYEGIAPLDLGNALIDAGRGREAIGISERAAVLFHDTGDRRREGEAWFNAARGLIAAERDGDAVGVLERSVTAAREAGERLQEALRLFVLGTTLTEVGRPGEAIGICRQAAEVFRECGNQKMAGSALEAADIAGKLAQR